MRLFEDKTGELIYIGDFKESMVYYTSNLAEKYGLPPAGEGYSFQMLQTILAENELNDICVDLAELSSDIEKMHTREYSLMGKDEIYRFITSKTRVQTDEEGNVRWFIGKLSMIDTYEKIDSLTGLLNMKALVEDLRESISCRESGFLMLLGIDNLKNINNQYGRKQGNQILYSVAQELKRMANASCKVYRLDGDRFAVNMIGNDRNEVEAFYEKLKDSVTSYCTISSGVVDYIEGNDSELIYQYAENALYSAKSNGKNMQVFFSEEVYKKHLQYVELQEELRNSVREGMKGFAVNYQPQIDTKTCKICGAEALLSYHSPVRGKISAEEFIEILEQTKLIIEVGDWVLEQALMQCKKWREVLPDFHVSVNISYIQLKEIGFTERVNKIINRVGLTGAALTFEITESMRLQDYQYFNKIFYKLAKLGIQISIDDFGTGYSSLSYLKVLSIDEVKIDRCFISNVQHSAYNYRLLSNIIELAHSANIKVCCEGVEVEAEFLVTQKLNADKIQGYLFAKNFTVEKFEKVYLDSSSEEYEERLRKEVYFSNLEKTDDEQLYKIRQEKIVSIIDNMEELVYVRNIDDYSLLYLNAMGRETSGVYDYKGRKCYEVLQGKDSPCEFCQNCHNESNGYSVWEIDSQYLNRYYLLKSKNIPWNGELARLTIAVDVTEKEIMTKDVQEKLDFEQNIVSCTKMLLGENDYGKAINNILKLIGEYYDADRAYLFELKDDKMNWCNTYEWCAEGVIPEIDNLQNVSLEITSRWKPMFAKGRAIIIDDIEKIKQSSPLEYQILNMQNIKSLLVAPVIRDDESIGFIGIDNPKKRSMDSGQVQTMAMFIADRLYKDDTTKRLKELLNLRYEDILQTTELGLWVIRMDQEKQHYELYADRTLLKILGVNENLTPEETYQHWYSRISNGYYHYVQYAIQNMIETGNIVELSYTWNHPEKGLVLIRCIGVRTADSDGMICIEGYHREINEINKPKFLPDHTSIIFEYHPEKRDIYFHTERETLAGDTRWEKDFPTCWLQNEIVHPHFAENFEKLFQDIEKKEDMDGVEFLLKTKAGSYEWFKLRIRHMENEKEGENTVLVLVDPANQERALELDYMRQKEFYEAILSEKKAYAEIDVESGHVVSSGGLWESYREESMQNNYTFSTVFYMHATQTIYPKDIAKIRKFTSIAYMRELLNKKQYMDKIEIRRLNGDKLNWEEVCCHVFQDKVAGNLYALFYIKDIDAQKKLELEREMEASRDPLTGLYNRRRFQQEVEKHMGDETESGKGSILLLDMDCFKQVNDTYGHAEGDTVLKNFAEALLQTFRRRDIIGRLGGDEFIVFLRDVTDKEILNRRMEELKRTLTTMEGRAITCSVGISFVKREGLPYEKYVEEADEAMYFSKQKGRNCYSYYDEIV